MRHALTKLSAEHREVIHLIYYHEQSVDEAAHIFGIPAATVKTRMFYARKKLGEWLKGTRLRRVGLDVTDTVELTGRAIAAGLSQSVREHIERASTRALERIPLTHHGAPSYAVPSCRGISSISNCEPHPHARVSTSPDRRRKASIILRSGRKRPPASFGRLRHDCMLECHRRSIRRVHLIPTLLSPLLSDDTGAEEIE